MHWLHTLNISVHVLAGMVALVVGLRSLLAPKRRGAHTRYGRIFLRLLTVVVSTGFVGLIFFRSSSFLIMLTLLAGYVGYAGFRTVKLRERRTSTADALIAGLVLMAGIGYLRWAKQAGGDWNPSVVYSTLGALALVTTYDGLKHVWLHERLRTWWLYEHIYKMLSAFSALLSAFTGTVLPAAKPYSQIGPSAVCLCLIAYSIWRQVRRSKQVPVRSLAET